MYSLVSEGVHTALVVGTWGLPVVTEIKSIALKLGCLGYPLSEEYQAMGILMALPPEWSFIHSIILNKTGPFTLQGTVDSL